MDHGLTFSISLTMNVRSVLYSYPYLLIKANQENISKPAAFLNGCELNKPTVLESSYFLSAHYALDKLLLILDTSNFEDTPTILSCWQKLEFLFSIKSNKWQRKRIFWKTLKTMLAFHKKEGERKPFPI